MKGVWIALALVAGLCLSAPTPAGEVKTSCCKPAPVVVPVAAPTPVALSTTTTYRTPDTVVETPGTDYAVHVPGQRQVIPGHDVTVQTAAPTPAFVPYQAVQTATTRTTTVAVPAKVTVTKKARLRTLIANRRTTVAAVPLATVPVVATTTVVEQPPETRRRRRHVERNVEKSRTTQLDGIELD